MPASSLSRRDFLRLAGLVSASAALAACAPVYSRLGGSAETAPAGALPTLAPVDYRALDRLTFGPRLSERARVAEIGLSSWIEEQLAPAALDDGPADWRLHRFDTLTMKAQDLADLGDQIFDNVDTTTVPDELRQATLTRQVYSRRQLYEVMVEFWSDHFNLTTAKGDGWFLKTVDDRAVIRPHALGNFRDLLWASAHSPAMLIYLDNQANVKGLPNENYARELMELHTLGVDGGYTQADVMNLARALTGWTVKERFWRGEFTFNPDLHDDGDKTVLGLHLLPEGQAEAEHVLEQLALHPATARFISTKLARRLLADEPPPEIVARATAAFLATSGDISAVLRVILLGGLAAPAAPVAAKFKRPINFVTAALRQLNAETDAGPAVHEYLLHMGQPYFSWPTPDGYPDRAAPWSGNLLPRWQFALALVRGEIPGTTVALAESATADPAAAVDALGDRLFGQPLAPAQRDALLSALRSAGATAAELPAIVAAGLLAAPAFQWR